MCVYVRSVCASYQVAYPGSPREKYRQPVSHATLLQQQLFHIPARERVCNGGCVTTNSSAG